MDSVIYYVPIALVTIASLLYYYVTRNFNYWKERGVAGPEPIALFGNMKEFALRRKNIGVIFRNIYDQFPNERVVGVYRMTTPCLVIRDLDLIKHIMVKDFDIFLDRGVEFSKKSLGANLFHSDGDTWRVLRNRFTPIFTSGKLKNMLYLMEERADSFVMYIDEICDKYSEQEVHALVQKYTMATISACAFGLDLDTQYNVETINTLKKIDKLIFTSSHVKELDMMFPGILKKLNTSLFPQFVTKFFNDLVKDVMRERNGVPSNRKDFMDLILELKQKGEVLENTRTSDNHQFTLELTDDVIAAQAFVFYLAGYETSATTMAFMLYQLAKNLDVQDKLIREVDSVLEKHSGKVTYDTLNDMTYMEYVFDETLRLYPLVEPLQRNANIDYKIPNTDITIKKGTTVLVSPYGIHHDEKYYPEPEKFVPERHTPEKSAERHTCAYMPFGVGPRNCIGMRFAKVQSRMCMTKFFSKFRVETCKETKASVEIDPTRSLIAPYGGITLRIVKRNK